MIGRTALVDLPADVVVAVAVAEGGDTMITTIAAATTEDLIAIHEDEGGTMRTMVVVGVAGVAIMIGMMVVVVDMEGPADRLQAIVMGHLAPLVVTANHPPPL